MKNLLSSLFLCFLIACSARPQVEDLVGNRSLQPAALGANEAPALWLALTDYRSRGELARLDLASGTIRYGVLPTAPDIYLVPDSDGLLLLQRNGGDSITRVRGANAQVEATFPLTNYVNPQAAVRDRLGRVWLVSLDSNSVDILSPDLRSRVASVDLSSLVVGNADPYAELYDLLPLSGDRMAVVAARVDRVSWTPQPQSGLAELDINSFSLLSKRDLAMANATQLFSLDGGSAFLVLGSGAQDAAIQRNGGFLRQGLGMDASELTTVGGRVIHGAMSQEGVLAWVEWQPERQRSCIRYGLRTLTCVQDNRGSGFFFYRVAVAAGRIFVSFSELGNHQIWVIQIENGAIEKMDLPMALGSMAPGP